MKLLKKLLTLSTITITTLCSKPKTGEFPTKFIPEPGDKIEVNLKEYYKDIKESEIRTSPAMKMILRVTNLFDKILSASQSYVGYTLTQDVTLIKMLNPQTALILVKNLLLVKCNLNHMDYLDVTKMKIEKFKFFNPDNSNDTDLRMNDKKCYHAQKYGEKIYFSCTGRRKLSKDADLPNLVAFLAVINPEDLRIDYVTLIKLDKVNPRFRIIVDQWYSNPNNQKLCAAIILGDGSVSCVEFKIEDEDSGYLQEESDFTTFIKDTRNDREMYWTAASFFPKGYFDDTDYSVLTLAGYQKFYEEKGEFYMPIVYCVKYQVKGQTTGSDKKYTLYRERIVNTLINQKDYKTTYFEVYKNKKYSSVGSYSLNMATRSQFIEVGIEKKGSYFLFMKPIYKHITGTDSTDALPTLYLENDYWAVVYFQENAPEKRKGIAVLEQNELKGGALKNEPFSVFQVFLEENNAKKKYYIAIANTDTNRLDVYYLNPDSKLILDYQKINSELKSEEVVELIAHDLNKKIHEKKLVFNFNIPPELKIERKEYEVQGTEMVKVKIGMENSLVKFLNLQESNKQQKAGYSLFLNKADITLKSDDKFKNNEIDQFLPIDDLYFFLGIKKFVNEGDGLYHIFYSIKCDINLNSANKNECTTTGTNKISASLHYIKDAFSVGKFIGIVVINIANKKKRILFYDRILNRMTKMTLDISEDFLVIDYVINTYDIQNSIDIYAVLKKDGVKTSTVSFQEVYLDPKENTLEAQKPIYFYAVEKQISAIYYEPKHPHIRLSLLFEQDLSMINSISNRYFLIVDFKRFQNDNFQILKHQIYEPNSRYPKAVQCPGKDFMIYFEKSRGIEVIIGEPKVNSFNGTSFKYNLEKGSYIIGSRCFAHLGVFQLLVSTYEGEKYFMNLRAEFDLDFRERYHSITQVSKDVIFFNSYFELGKDFITTTFVKRSEKLGDEKLVLLTYFKGPEFMIDTSKLKFDTKGVNEFGLEFIDIKNQKKTEKVTLKKVELPKSEITTKKDFPPKGFKVLPPQTLLVDDMVETKGPVIDIKIQAPEGLIEGKNYTYHGRKPQVYGFFNNTDLEIRKMDVYENWLVALIYNTKDSSMSIQAVYKPTELSDKYKNNGFELPLDKSKTKDTIYNGVKLIKIDSVDGKLTETYLLATYQSHSEKGYFIDGYKFEKNGELEKPVKVFHILLEKQQFADDFYLINVNDSEKRLMYYEGFNLVVYKLKKQTDSPEWKSQGNTSVIELDQEVRFCVLRRVKVKSDKLIEELEGTLIFYTNSGSSKISTVWLGDKLNKENIESKKFEEFSIYNKDGQNLGKVDLFNCDTKSGSQKYFTTEKVELNCYTSFSGANDYFLTYTIDIVNGFNDESIIFKDVKIASKIVSTKGFESIDVRQSDKYLAVKMKNLRKFDKVNSFSECPYIVTLYQDGEIYSFAAVDCREIGAHEEKDEPEFSILTSGDKELVYISSKKKPKTPISKRNLQDDDNKEDHGRVKVFIACKAKLMIINTFKLAGFKLTAETENGIVTNTNVMQTLMKLLEIPLKIQLKISSIIWFLIVFSLIMFIGLCGIQRISKQSLKSIIKGEVEIKDKDTEDLVKLDAGRKNGIIEEVNVSIDSEVDAAEL